MNRDSTARELLFSPLRLDIAPDESVIRLDARLDRGDHFDVTKVALPIARGWVDLATIGGQLALQWLELSFATIDLPAMPADIRLVDVRVHLVRPALSANAVWRGDDRSCAGSVTAALELDWSLGVGDDVFPLAPQRLGNVALGVALSGGAAALSATLLAAVPGMTWNWADVLFLGDLTAALRATW